jgi:hypothetical protein
MRLPTAPSEFAFAVILLVSTAGCSTLQPTDPNGPRSSESVYPYIYTTDDVRRNEVTAELSRFVQPVNAGVGPLLRPVTLTVENLGQPPTQPLYLPKLGTAAVMNEDETRESLRRFIKDWQHLIGSDPTKLSLIERVDQPDGIKLATYEQRPFRYPIRGNFGRLQIRFAPDRRVVSMTSTCIPGAERVQSALTGVIKLKAEDAVNQLVNNPVPAGDIKPTFTVQAAQVTPRELVTYVRPSKTNPDALEFHVAWEIEVRGAPAQRVYVDAVNGEIIASE